MYTRSIYPICSRQVKNPHMHRHIRVCQYISNLICDPTLDNLTCSLVKCCHFRRVSWSRIQRSSVHLQIAAQRSPSTCTNEINTDAHIDPTQSPRAWYVYPQAFESLELEKLFLRITLFWTETSDVTPGICWSHSSGLGLWLLVLLLPLGPPWGGLPSTSATVVPLANSYFCMFSCSSFLMLLSTGTDTCITNAVFCSLSNTIMWGFIFRSSCLLYNAVIFYRSPLKFFFCEGRF